MCQLRDRLGVRSHYQYGAVHSAFKETQLPVFPNTKRFVFLEAKYYSCSV